MMSEDKRKSVIALGFFDGVHLGHRKLIEETVRIAGEKDLIPTVFTFRDFPSKDFEALTLPEEKERIFKKLGISRVIFYDFPEIKDMKAEDFFNDILIDQLDAASLVAGTDYSFGKGASGDIKLLKKLSDEKGIHLEIVPDVICDGEKCSSTRIRNLLSEGKIQKANELLGDNAYSFEGTVLPGKKLGRRLGFPTANLPVPQYKFKPVFGVYRTYIEVDGKKLMGISNLGLRPTVEDSDNVNIETFIYGFDGELYGKYAKVMLMEFIRGEMKFNSVEELKARVESDKKMVANLWELGNN